MFAEAIAASVANGPNSSSLKATAAPDLQLLASSDDKIASLAWTVDVSQQKQAGKLTSDQFTLKASGKLDEGEAEILGLKGFPNGAQVKLAYTHFHSSVNLSGREKDAVRVARERCLRVTPAAQAAACNPYDYAEGGVSEFVLKYNKEGLRPLLDEVLPGPVWFGGVEFEGTQSGFKYLDRTSFAIQKKRGFGYGGTLFGGALLGRGATAVTGAFTHRRQYKERDPVTLCQPVPNTIQTQCLTGADGPPGRNTASILSLELRHAFDAGVGNHANLAIAPEFSVDVANVAWSIDVPIYFASDSTGKLRGGVRGVYLNEEDAEGERSDSFTLGLFVGVPFSFFRN